MSAPSPHAIEIKTPATIIITGSASDRKGGQVIQRTILSLQLNATNRIFVKQETEEETNHRSERSSKKSE